MQLIIFICLELHRDIIANDQPYNKRFNYAVSIFYIVVSLIVPSGAQKHLIFKSGGGGDILSYLGLRIEKKLTSPLIFNYFTNNGGG